MDDEQGGGGRRGAAEELILRTIAAHADSLLRTARRHSICVDDAHDAYQRSIEIFMGHAHRLDPARAAGWLHVVVKREAQALREARQKLLTSTQLDADREQASSVPSPEEQMLSFDIIQRSAEALQRLKPNELRALWLRAQGHSYSEIGAITGWSYTKVNRCLTEGRRSFLERYEGIESGEECARWLPVISAMVDGEATPEQIVDLRPHLRNCAGCRATLKALRDSSTPLAAVLPVPLVAVTAGAGDQLVNILTRIYEGVAGGLHERAVNTFTKTQAVIEATTAGKVAAVAASAAAVAGGGYGSMERVLDAPARQSARQTHHRATDLAAKPAGLVTAASPKLAKRPSERNVVSSPMPKRSEFGSAPASRQARAAPEFRLVKRTGSRQTPLNLAGRSGQANASAAGVSVASSEPAADSRAPEFAPPDAAPEFGP